MNSILATMLKSARIAAGMTQQQAADALKVKKNTISNYENGVSSPAMDDLAVLCDLYGIDMGDTLNAAYDTGSKNTPSISDEALKVARDYSDLDQPGKNVVRVVIAEEGKRVQAEKERRQVEPAEPSQTRLIPLYYTPAAAGLTEPAAGEDFDYIEVGADVPRKADCAIKIRGDSMEPYIRDGSIVYVTREPLENGDVGIFCVDGDMLCKQYYRNEKGNVHLVSLNRERADADRFIHAKSDTVMTYYGKVILPRRPIVNLA